MFKFMKFEIKRNLKKSQVKILIGLLLICELVMLVVLNNKAQIEDVFSLSQGSMEVSALTRLIYLIRKENISKNRLNL